MAPNCRFRISRPKVVYEKIDGEVIAINFDTGDYFSLNASAGEIWHYIENRASLSEIVEAMHRIYDGNGQDLESVVSGFIDILLKEGLIKPEESRTSNSPDHNAGKEIHPDKAKAAFFPPQLSKYTDMQGLLLFDPIHEVDENGWPAKKPNTSGAGV